MQWITQPTTQPGNDASSTMDGRRKTFLTPYNRTINNLMASRHRNVRQLLPGNSLGNWIWRRTFRQDGRNQHQPWVSNTHPREQLRSRTLDTIDANSCQTWMLTGRMETLHRPRTTCNGGNQGRLVSQMKIAKKKETYWSAIKDDRIWNDEEEEDLADQTCKMK